MDGGSRSKDEMVTICPPPGPRNIEQTLRREYNAHMEGKATRQARGEASEPVMIEIVVATSTVEAVDAVVDFLNDNDARVFSWNKEGDATAAGGVYARVNIELLFAIGEIEGVLQVEKALPHQPTSFNRQGGVGSALQVVQADQWHRAGFTGAGVEVAVVP